MVKGSCFCGKIKYSISGKLFKGRSCHCSRCRKAFSAQASAYAQVDSNHFKWTCGQDLLTSYTNNQGFGLQFCSRCGSTLCGIHNNKVHGVTLGCLDGNPSIEIEHHIFIGSKAKWEKLPENIITYEAAAEDS
ncbi:MAG: GFA family protein [Oligoflexales bacterium]